MNKPTNQSAILADAYECLKQYRDYFTKQQYTCFKGQIRAGQIYEAQNGMAKVLERNGYKKARNDRGKQKCQEGRQKNSLLK